MIGLLRVKNEERWIERCIESIRPLCGTILVFDDHSTDNTAALCARMPGVSLIYSPFADLNETRDKNWLLDKARGVEWVLMIDGDEVLQPSGVPIIREAIKRPVSAYSLRVLYLWDSEDQVRTDGVYGRFRRPSLFRPSAHRFVSTQSGGFHCGNVPSALQLVSQPLEASLLHYGYLHAEDRVRKYRFYNAWDSGSIDEDGYRHIVQGDLPEVPATAELKHAGPLRLETLCSAA